MSNQFSKRINTHHYPKLYFQYPFLMHLNFLWFRMVYQRIGVTYHYFEKYLKQLPNGSVVADAGFGEGQFLFRYAKRFEALRFHADDSCRNEKYSKDEMENF